MSLSASYTSVNTSSKTNLKKSVQKWFSCITIEPIFICYMLAFTMSSLTHQNLNLEKTCHVNFNLSKNICHALSIRNLSGFDSSHEKDIQQLVAEAYIWKNVIISVCPTIILILLGSWSDRNQCRKVLILLPLIGQLLSNVGLIISTYFFDEIAMEFNVLIDVLPAALTGATPLLLVGVFSHISESTSDDKKTWKLGIVHIIFTISGTTGTALSGIMYRWIGFYGVFSTSATLYLFGIIYGVYFVQELNLHTKNHNEVFKDIFNIKETLNQYQFMGEKAYWNKTKIILIITFLGVLNIGPSVGENAVLYLYTRYKFVWDEVDFSIFFTYYSVAHLIGSAFALSFLSKYLKIDDALLGVISATSKILGGIVYIIAPTAVIFYIGTLLEMFSALVFVASRSILSKTIPAEELGRANSVLGIAEAFATLIYAPMYSALYRATLGIFCASFFLLGVVLSVPSVLTYIWLYIYQKRNKTENVVVEVNKESLLKNESA